MRTSSRLKALVLACVFAAGLGPARGDWIILDENTGLEPLLVAPVFPLELMRPNATMIVPPDDDGLTAAGVHASYASVWVPRDGYFMDGEWVTFALHIVQPVLPGLGLGAILPVSGRIGGGLDSGIESFHRAFGFSKDNRDLYPRNTVLLDFKGADGQRFYRADESWGIGDVPVFLSWMPTAGGTYLPAVVMQAGASIPAGEDEQLRGAGNPVFFGGLRLSKYLGTERLVGFASFMATHASKINVSVIPLRKDWYSGLAGLEWRVSDRTSLTAQYLASSSTVTGYADLDASTHLLELAFKRATESGGVFEVGVGENLFHYQTNTDIAFHVGFSQDF